MNGTAAATFTSTTTPFTSVAQILLPYDLLTATSNAFDGMSHCMSDGWLQPVVDPLNVGVEALAQSGGPGVRAHAPIRVARLDGRGQSWPELGAGAALTGCNART